ncbi:VCBS repeat-containing protein [bacterium]|nr:VCBS repeat-containing protein [bacterium]
MLRIIITVFCFVSLTIFAQPDSATTEELIFKSASTFIPSSSITLDYDNDGFMDSFVTVLDGQSALYRNTGLSPQGVPQMVNNTATAFSDLKELYNLRDASTVDFNNDGWEDLLVTSENNIVMYQNVFNQNSGMREFLDVTETLNLADMNHYNNLDYFVTRFAYLPSSESDK